MKLIKILILLFLFSCCSNAQNHCKLNDVIDDFLNTEVPYSEDETSVDLTDVFTNSTVPYIGFIGESKRKIDFFITLIKRDTINNNRYLIEGQTKVYSESTRNFKGELLLEKQYKFSKKLDEEVSYSDIILKQGFSILTYELKEDNRGVFKGKLMVLWYQDTDNNINYDDTLDYIPSYANCYFFGSWINKDKNEKILTAWSHYRIPCSGDLDIGAAEFSPNPKYYNQGWKLYSSEEGTINPNSEFAKIVDKDGYVNMREKSNTTSKILSQIQSGKLVEILEQKDEWWLVLYDNKKGYIHKSRLRLVK
ncbi:SH3 domain-containing protein [Tenacibaculum sp. 1_MG-2023]|uniref:SH3 domain-containing protein n=1 Tax=Tenacibaculum sp. 1_MG-2023 TaxID=3062653 RepID=UPI0026E4921F|nr:SH3 domain-containing protein [Tenacibaculum sp. 1_MG-2023]MDO6676589.1 SH3 domain-containing protein [Tenacibaculum sp. 1_MG-2023]